MRIALRLLCLLLLSLVSPSATAQSGTRRIERFAFIANDGHSLRVFRRSATAAPKGTILLLHGRTWSSIPNFDLTIGRTSHSLMASFAAAGYDVYAMDQRGYGETKRDTSGWLTPDRASQDVAIVLDSIAGRARRGAPKPIVIGYSQGTRYGALAVMRNPEKVRGFVMYGFAVDVTRPLPTDTTSVSPARRPTTAAGAAEDFITPASTPAGVKERYIEVATTLDPVRMDWRHDEQFNAIDPAKIAVPVMILAGERDPVTNGTHPAAFYERLGGVDRAWVVLANADHVAHLERQRDFVTAVTSFFERIARR